MKTVQIKIKTQKVRTVLEPSKPACRLQYSFISFLPHVNSLSPVCQVGRFAGGSKPASLDCQNPCSVSYYCPIIIL